MSEPLDDLDDEELGKLVRNTAAFRAAAACARFADEAQELRENDTLAFDRLIAETHQQQGTSVSVRETTAPIIETFLDVVQEYGQLAEEEADVVERGVEEVGDS
jgi:hypothetical protein